MIRKSRYRFSERSCSIKTLERDGSHCALVIGEIIDGMIALRHQHGPLEADEDGAVSLAAGRAHGDDPLGAPLCRLTLGQNLGFRVDRIADEDRCGETNVGPAEIADRLLADVADAHADD